MAPNSELFSILCPVSLHCGSPDTCFLLNTKEVSTFTEPICQLQFFFLSTILDASNFFLVCFTGFLPLGYISCSFITQSPEGQPSQAAACANGTRLQGSQTTGRNQGLSLTSLFLGWCLWQLLAFSHGASSHTWQCRLPPDAPALLSPPQCVDLEDPAAGFVANLETAPPS